jgi:hypothetical protein
MHGNNVDSTTLLGDSEVLAVKHTPRHAIPEFVQRLEYDREVTSSVAREKPVHVFEDNCSWHALSSESHKVVKEPRLVPSKPRSRPHAREREVLARESGSPNGSIGDLVIAECPNVFCGGYVRPVLAKNFAAERFDFTLKFHAKSGSL